MRHGKKVGNKMKRRKSVFFTVIVTTLVLGAAGIAAFYIRSAKNGKDETVYRVRSEVFNNVIEIAGVISAAKEQNLQAAGDGTVTAVHVKEGDVVKKGQIILQMDDSEQRYNLEKHDYEMDQKQLTGSPRELKIMAVQREVLLQRIRDRQISANFDGVIAEFTVSAGDVLEAKDVAGVIIDRGYLAANVEVVETDAPKLKAGQRVTLSFPARGNEPIEGRVHSFPAVATKSSRGASVVKAEIRVDDPPDIILPNYSFTGKIEISPPVKLLLVEREAVGFAGGREGAPGGQFAEIIAENGEKRRVSVRVEPYGGGFVKILEGLSEGDVLAAQETRPVSGGNGAPRAPAQSAQNRNAGGQTATSIMPAPPAPQMGGGRRAR
jgi:multidrug efflux pump subunit AcrA (membrane-fusion protein)